MNADEGMISEEVAQEILKSLGIMKATRAYERWVKPGGFRTDEFWEVASESPLFCVIDWRGVLEEELQSISRILEQFEIQMDYKLNSDYVSGRVLCDGKSAAVRYCPADDGADIDEILLAVQNVIPERIRILASRDNGGGDTSCYIFQSRKSLGSLGADAKRVIQQYFEPFGKDAKKRTGELSRDRNPSGTIPIEFAFEVRKALQIPKLPEVLRWMSDGASESGFVDFLQKSPFAVELDSTCDPVDEIARIRDLLEKNFNLNVKTNMERGSREGVLSCGWWRARVQIEDQDGGWWPDQIVRSLRKVIPGRIQIRGPNGNQNRAKALFLILRIEQWRELDTMAPKLMQKFFYQP